MQSISGIILAGGASRRMGRDKAWIEFEGQPLVERVILRLGRVCQETILVTGNEEPFRTLSAEVVPDVFPGKGSLGGIYSGLKAASFEHAVVVGCDMPFLNVSLFKYLVSLSSDYDVVIPSGSSPRSPRDSRKGKGSEPIRHLRTAKDDNLHPLHAVYSKRCMAPIEARLRADDLRMIGFHENVRVRVVESRELERFDPEHISLFNVNTPEDLALAELLAEKERTIQYDQC